MRQEADEFCRLYGERGEPDEQKNRDSGRSDGPYSAG